MTDLAEIIEHTVLEPGEWLVLRVSQDTDPDAQQVAADQLREWAPDLASRTLIVAGEFQVLRPTEEHTDV